MSNYYKDQLKKINLNSEYPISIKISDDKNSTNFISLNPKSVMELEEWLKELKDHWFKEGLTKEGGS